MKIYVLLGAHVLENQHDRELQDLKETDGSLLRVGAEFLLKVKQLASIHFSF